ncbi:MAG: hypothetical protein HYZ71_14540 [Deltaproteobacteria bacterium]|nr:hypothetical protein [Deltaproteobacteria bacterium]
MKYRKRALSNKHEREECENLLRRAAQEYGMEVGYFARSVGEGVTGALIKRYIEMHEERALGPAQAEQLPHEPKKNVEAHSLQDPPLIVNRWRKKRSLSRSWPGRSSLYGGILRDASESFAALGSRIQG